MDGVRLSLILPARSAAELIPVARWADTWNLAGLWVGDPRGTAPNSDDSYVMTTAAALAAVTETLRLGVFLTLRGSAWVERVADDIGVVDNMSGGRLELGLVAPDRDAGEWTKSAIALLRSWHGWPVDDAGDTAPVTPQPVQPSIPRVVVGDEDVAQRLLAGRVLLGDDAGRRPNDDGATALRRDVLLIEPALEDGVFGWLSPDPPGRIHELRQLAADAGATELALVVSENRELTEQDVKVLGTVVVPCLRTYGGHVDTIVGQAWSWLTDKEHLHEVPA